MPNGKPAGQRCVNLTRDNRCALFGQPQRPKFCLSFRPSPDVCGDDAMEALRLIGDLELATLPHPT